MPSLTQVLRFIRDGVETRRFHGQNVLTHETVGHHSARMALLCCLLGKAPPSANLLMSVLVHDLAEHELGDMPGNVKAILGVALEHAEQRMLSDHGMVFELTDEERYLLRLADTMDGFLFTINERHRGNKMLDTVRGRYRGYVLGLVSDANTDTHINDMVEALLELEREATR